MRPDGGPVGDAVTDGDRRLGQQSSLGHGEQRSRAQVQHELVRPVAHVESVGPLDEHPRLAPQPQLLLLLLGERPPSPPLRRTCRGANLAAPRAD